MKTKNTLYGAMCGLLAFAVLSWAAPKKGVRAAVLSAPPEGRFQLVQLHPSSRTEWSGILDTETGCTWLLTSNPSVSASAKTNDELFLHLEGPQFFQIVNFDAVEYGFYPVRKGNVTDFTSPEKEMSRVAGLCDKGRLQALQASTAR